MKVLVIALFVLAAVQMGMAQTAKYDKFEDETTISLTPMQLDFGPQDGRMQKLYVDVQYSFKGIKTEIPIKNALIMFNVRCSSWCYPNNHQLIFLADGKRIDLGSGQRVSQTDRVGSKVYTLEVLGYDISSADLKTIGNAKSLEMQLGFLELTFDKGTKAGLALMALWAESPALNHP